MAAHQEYLEYIGQEIGLESKPSYVFASPDGSHAFFSSTDRLTEMAPEDGTVKTYVFNLDTRTLEYVPGIDGSIVTVSNDGSSAVFENTSSTPHRLERWVMGPGGGSVTSIAQLPSVSPHVCGENVVCVGPAYTSSDGSVTVFETEAPIPGFNDGGSHYGYSGPLEGEKPLTEKGLIPNREVFRYDSRSEQLDCLSCPPKGVTPSGDGIMSKLTAQFNAESFTGRAEVTSPGRAVSADGARVFFETRQALVPQDVNGLVDVYEWENGTIYLVSSGVGLKSSFLSGISETGGDVFFMTSDGIAAGDRDGAYDVYDARVPRPGDVPPPEELPCDGAVCQGAPSVPQLLGQPASETFNGAGNLVPVPPGRSADRSLSRAQKLARALRACRSHGNRLVRRRCEQRARGKYRAKGAGAVRAVKHKVDLNGRGK